MTRFKTIVTVLALLLGGCAMNAGPKPAGAAVAPVRVLVQIAVAPDPASPTAIADAQSAVIAALPTSGVRVVRRYQSLPLLALEVDPALVPSLERIPHVTSVQPDQERSIQD
jgi:hypothetical protein